MEEIEDEEVSDAFSEAGRDNAQLVTPPLAFSLLMFHPSAPPPSDNLFGAARQSLIRTELWPGLPRPEIAGPAYSHISEDDFGQIAPPHRL